MKKISVIVPVYNEEGNIPLVYGAIVEMACGMPGYGWELVFVNDGSTDGSWRELVRLAEGDRRVVALDFSRNFGKEQALTAGVRACTGDAAVFLDADMQHPPSLIPEFVRRWESGAEVVASLRRATAGKSALREAGSRLFYWLMNDVAHAGLTANATDFKLIDRKVVDELVRLTEHKRLFRGLIEWLGFRTEYVEFEAPERASGHATYSVRKLVGLAVNGMASFSLWPLRLTGYLGVLVGAVSFVLLVVMCVHRLVSDDDLFSPISYVIVTNTFVLGVVLMALGLLALYIGQIHAEVMNRPLYVVRERIGGRT